MTIPPSITRLMPFLACEGGSIDNAPKVTLTLGEIKAFTESATSSVEVDEDWYQLQYTDVRAAVEKADLSSATEHYQRTGFLECRLPSKPIIDEDWYELTHPDVARAAARGTIQSAIEHYIQRVYLEGRSSLAPTVDEDWYKAAYPDVANAIESCQTPRSHFVQRGYLEGRQARSTSITRQSRVQLVTPGRSCTARSLPSSWTRIEPGWAGKSLVGARALQSI